MLLGRQLLEYERSNNRLAEIKEQLSNLEKDKNKLLSEQNQLNITLESINNKTDTIDTKIEKALTEQRIIMIRKEIDRIDEGFRQNSFQLMQEQFELEHKVQTIKENLAEDVWLNYERIKENVENAVVEVKHQMCTGCFMSLSVENLSQWRRNKGLVYCNVCGRILA